MFTLVYLVEEGEGCRARSQPKGSHSDPPPTEPRPSQAGQLTKCQLPEGRDAGHPSQKKLSVAPSATPQ